MADEAELGGDRDRRQGFDHRMLQTMARRIGARVTEVRASHAVFTTQATAVADVSDAAARELSGS